MSAKSNGLNYEKIVSRILSRNGFEDVKGTIGSGNLWFDKGDRTARWNDNNYLIEIKGTKQTKYRVSGTLLNKIWDEALTENKTPLFVFLIKNEINYVGIIELEMEWHRSIIAGIPKTCNFNVDIIEQLIDTTYRTNVCYKNKIFNLKVQFIKETT